MRSFERREAHAVHTSEAGGPFDKAIGIWGDAHDLQDSPEMRHAHEEPALGLRQNSTSCGLMRDDTFRASRQPMGLREL